MAAKNKKNSIVNNKQSTTKKNKDDKNPKKSNNIIFAYSALEQKRHDILSPVDCLMIFLKTFPFVILAADLYSCFIKRLSTQEYKRVLLIAGGFMILGMIINVVLWINRIFYVYMLDENNNFYRLRISNFWYKIRRQTQLLNPYDMVGGRLTKVFYMISNIKSVLQNISDTVTYDELIAMGRLEKISNISDVSITKKRYLFTAKIVDREHNEGVTKKVSISRSYENDRVLLGYLKNGVPGEEEKISDIILELKSEKTPLKRTIQFTITWSCIVAWFAVIILSGDFSKLAGINAGEYVKSIIKEENGIEKEVYMSVHNNKDYFAVADYGKLYKPIIVVYAFVELIYMINRFADVLVKKVMKEKQES
ncbi:MAG: hypothetical protein II919_02740 [Lachnospiraceae bacterium]|nr:hypothetical protein [Lachnospiraceae bacterium]